MKKEISGCVRWERDRKGVKMDDKVKVGKVSGYGTANIMKDSYCGGCGWPVILTCCNDETADLHPGEDWWVYCSNQGCKNHPGECYGQHNEPTWLASV